MSIGTGIGTGVGTGIGTGIGTGVGTGMGCNSYSSMGRCLKSSWILFLGSLYI